MALVVTIVVLLILAGITIMYVFGDNSVFNQALNAKEQTFIAKAREKLEVVLSNAQIEKNTNNQYDEIEDLNRDITSQIEKAEIIDDIAIVDGYAFELDRSVPKVGKYVGKKEDLIFPKVTVAEVIQADSTDKYRTATITITATIDEKAKNGINRIEIWQSGVKLSTIPCNNEKTVTKEYKAIKNGIYTIKAYADVSGSAKTTVEGIVPAVEFTPNGSTEWKKSHTTTIKVVETVTEMKYLWKKSSEGEPHAGEFTESCANNSTITGKGETMTGKYYLWVCVTLGTGTNRRTYINGSEEFYFDNEGPEINIVTTPESEKSFTIEINASDNCEIVRYDIYIDDNAIDGTNIDLSKPIITIDNMETRTNHRCRVIAYDRLGNSNFFETECATMLFAFDKYSVSKTKSYEIVETEGSFQCTMSSGERSHNAWTSIKVDPSTGEISGAGKVTTMSGTMSYYSRTYPYTKVYDHDYAWFRTTGEERLTDPYKSPSVNRIDGFFITAELKWINPVRGDYIDRVWGNSRIDFETSCESPDGYWYEYIGVMEKRDS